MRVLLIHGFEGSRNSNWLPWLEEQLLQSGYEVVNRTWPNSYEPDFDEVMSFLKELAQDFGETDILVGHSLGALFALKLLEWLSGQGKSLAGVFLVAPAVGGLDFEHLQSLWPESDVSALRSIVGKGVQWDRLDAFHKQVFFSTNDPFIGLHAKDIFPSDWEKTVLAKRGHFMEREFMELLEVILAL